MMNAERMNQIERELVTLDEELRRMKVERDLLRAEYLGRRLGVTEGTIVTNKGRDPRYRGRWRVTKLTPQHVFGSKLSPVGEPGGPIEGWRASKLTRMIPRPFHVVEGGVE
jgi:hypothetical protein